MRSPIGAVPAVALAAFVVSSPSMASAQPADLPIPAATTSAYPPGVHVAKTAGGKAGETAGGAVYVDRQGRVLYGLDMRVLLRAGPDPAQYCQAACSQVWEPLAAPAGAKPNIAYPIGNRDRGGTGNAARSEADGKPPRDAPGPFYDQPQKAPDWTVIAAPQGPQWVYKGWHLVFTRRGDKLGSTAFDGAEDKAWNTLKFMPPPPELDAPSSVKALAYAGAYVLADTRGHVLFTGRCTQDCPAWRPLSAGMASAEVGGWAVDNRGETPRWAYRGKPVFVSESDDPARLPQGAQALHP